MMEDVVRKIAITILLAGFAAQGADLGPELLSATRKGESERVAELLSKGAPIEAKDKNGRTSLVLAAQRGHAEAVRVLLEKGANPDARDKQGWTAFGLALIASHEDVLRVLPQPPKLRLTVQVKWLRENLYSSCLMSPEQLTQQVAGIQPEMIVLAAFRDVASVSAKGMVDLAAEEGGDAVLDLKVRPGAACVAQKSADNLSLAIDVRLIRSLDQKVLLEKTFGGGLKGLHVRTATSPAQYGSLYADWAKSHATAIYWAVLEAWLRAAP